VPPESREQAPAPEALSGASLQAPRAAVAVATPALALARAPEPASVVESRAEPSVRPAESPGASSETWASIVGRLRTIEPRWAAMYEHGIPLELSSERVVVAFPEGSFFGRQAQTPAGSDALRRASSEVLGATPEIQIRLASEVRGKSLAQKEAALLDERKEGIKKRALNHPRVLEALKVFPELAQKQEIQVD
jgi:hypothetical protein